MAKHNFKVRVTLNGTVVEDDLDELLKSGVLKIEYDQAELNKITQEAVAIQRAEYQKDPQHYHVHTMTMDELSHHPCTTKPGGAYIRHWNVWDSTIPCMANQHWKAYHDLAQ